MTDERLAEIRANPIAQGIVAALTILMAGEVSEQERITVGRVLLKASDEIERLTRDCAALRRELVATRDKAAAYEVAAREADDEIARLRTRIGELEGTR